MEVFLRNYNGGIEVTVPEAPNYFSAKNLADEEARKNLGGGTISWTTDKPADDKQGGKYVFFYTKG